MTDNLVTVATFGSPVEAALAKNLLDSAGLRAFLADETTVAMAWQLSGAVEVIKLQVAERDVEDALAVLVEQADSAAQVESEDWELPTSREKNADRALRGAVFGLLFLPLQFYVFWLLFRVLMSDEALRPDKRRKAIVATVINLPLMCAFCLILGLILSD